MFMKKATAALLVLALVSIMPLAFSEENSGAKGDVAFMDNLIDVGEFNERSDGRLTITLTNSATIDKTVNVYVKFLNGGKLTSRNGVVIPAGDGTNPGTVKVDLFFRISSPGTHYVSVFADPETEFLSDDSSGTTKYFNYSKAIPIEVGSSIWSNTSTYLVIIVVIIIIAIAVFLRMRSKGAVKKDNAGVFTAMEEQKKEKTRYEPVVKYEEEPDDLDDFDDFDEELEDEPVKQQPAKPVPVKSQSAKQQPASGTGKQEYTGRVSSSKSKKASPQRKSKRR